MQINSTKLPILPMYSSNATRSILFVLISLSILIPVHSQNSIETIVIDAGHGGKDPGCHGKFSKENTSVYPWL